MEKFKIAVLMVMASVIGFGLVVFGLYYLASIMEQETIRWFFVGLVLLVFIGIPMSYYFGHSEARGFLAGADRIADKTLGTMVVALEQREQRKRMLEAQMQAGLNQGPMAPLMYQVPDEFNQPPRRAFNPPPE